LTSFFDDFLVDRATVVGRRMLLFFLDT
jgi:hypothetical protein